LNFWKTGLEKEEFLRKNGPKKWGAYLGLAHGKGGEEPMIFILMQLGQIK
jgi:hypothetical protein